MPKRHAQETNLSSGMFAQPPDVQAFMTMPLHNLETVNQVTALLLQSMQELTKREMEILQPSLERMNSGFGEVMRAESAQEMINKQAELYRLGMDCYADQTREMSHLSCKYCSDVFENLSKRWGQLFDASRPPVGAMQPLGRPHSQAQSG